MNSMPQSSPLQLREKLMTQGVKSLSDEELLAVFISSGSGKKSCKQLAAELINKLGDLRTILNADYRHFNTISGLGIVRFLQLQAVQEICRRSEYICLQRDTRLSNSHQTYRFLKKQLRDKKYETFAALFLDNQHQVIAYEELFQGTINTATVYARPLIDRVLHHNAAAIILAHNHPSGWSDASQEDIALTEHFKQALNLIDTNLLDHLVIGDNEVYSIMSSLKSIC